MQHKWVTWSLQMFRCILSQFISLWDYWIVYLQQKYGHLSRMSSNSGRVEDSVQYRSLGPRVEAGSGVRGYSRYANPGLLGHGPQCGAAWPGWGASSARPSPARGRGSAWRAPPRTPRSAQTSSQLPRPSLPPWPAPWYATHCACALVWQGPDLLTLAACSGLSSESTRLQPTARRLVFWRVAGICFFSSSVSVMLDSRVEDR